MPFVQGRTLEAILDERKRLPLGEVLSVVRAIGAALDFAHARGVVHRDVKPANILQEEGTRRTLLTDFGVARAVNTPTGSLTAPGTAVGTPDYMAPEQVGGGDAVDGRADLYALAVVAFEALTGTLPAIRAERPALTRALQGAVPRLPRAVAAALVAPLTAAPADRPATAGAWLAQLDRARRGRWRQTVAPTLAVLILLGLGGRALCRARVVCRAAPASHAIAVLPFSVLGTSPFSSPRQLAETFIGRFAPVEGFKEVLSLRRGVTQMGPGPVPARPCHGTGRSYGRQRACRAPGLRAAPDRTHARRQPDAGRLRSAARARRRRCGAGTVPRRDARRPQPAARLVRAGRVLRTLRHPLWPAARIGRGRLHPRPRSRAAVRAGPPALNLPFLPARRPAGDAEPHVGVPTARLHVGGGACRPPRRPPALPRPLA